MARVPVIGRLFLFVTSYDFGTMWYRLTLLTIPRREYFALLGSLILVGFEVVIRVITLLLRMYIQKHDQTDL